ncbi:MAG: hypothetical protein LC723_07310, partial [Actinobacteria bacterium]|nr:hypothetical protein [Actinomycetota bacterium]
MLTLRLRPFAALDVGDEVSIGLVGGAGWNLRLYWAGISGRPFDCRICWWLLFGHAGYTSLKRLHLLQA